MSKKKNVIARVGNFEITKDSSVEHDAIRIRAIGGHWSITHRDDSPMYGLWTKMCSDPEYTKGMEVIIVMSYYLTNSLLDKEFVDDFFKALDAMEKRRVAAAPVATDKEQAEAIAEVKTLEDLKANITE